MGMFDADIFRRWKQVLIKMNEYKKVELVELFKNLDERKRGVIKADSLLKEIDAIIP